MNNFDLGSKKYMIIILAIFMAFALVIIKAFDYLPDSQDEANVADINRAVEMRNQPMVQNTEESQEEQTDKKEFNVDLQSSVNVPEEARPSAPAQPEELEKIEPVEESSNNLSAEQQLELRFLTAQKYKDEKQYVKALEEYQSIAAAANSHTQARCYEEIANVYGIVKRYGTALSYAQKAYNMEPTSQREMLLARLYYKTGDLDKATKRMNNVLHREFAEN